VNRGKNKQVDPRGCADFRQLFQDYLDSTLEKQESLQVFLHLRECSQCHVHLEETKTVFQLLESLPTPEIPAGFDDKILASIPYQAYKEMEPIRRERMPVYLEREFLPAAIRSTVTRSAGFGLALVSGAGLVSGWLPDWTVLFTAAGLFPEAAVRLQGLGRWLTLVTQRSES